jgi:hypothetical protein
MQSLYGHSLSTKGNTSFYDQLAVTLRAQNSNQKENLQKSVVP